MKPHALVIALLNSVLAGVSLAQAPAARPDEHFRASATLEGDNAPRPPQTPGNAAWAYFKAWDTITLLSERTAFGEAMGDRPSGGKRLTKAQREQLEKHRDYFDGVLAATAMPVCDFGPRYEEGFYALLPYLGFLRASCRALGVDATRCAEDGNSPGAAERLAGILHLSVHAAHDRFLISSLVGIAIGAYAANATNDLIAQHQLTPAAARIVLPVLREVTATQDLYNMGACIDGERDTALNWLRAQCTGPAAGVKFMRLMGDLGPAQPRIGGWPPGHLYLNYDEQRLAGEFDRAERYYNAIKLAWSKPNAAVMLDEIGVEANECQYGMVAATVGASFTRARMSIDRIKVQLARLDANLSAIIKANRADAPVPYAN